MPRKPRFNLIGLPQHVIQRGNNREPCFFSGDDCSRYLQDLEQSARQRHCLVHAYVLMTNHAHLVATPLVAHGISSMMQTLGRRYVRYVNKTYHRTGTLWEGRYKSSLVDEERYLLTCMRYVELNPVRASMVSHPAEYRWSSYRANAQGEVSTLLTVHEAYEALGGSPSERQHVYRELFAQRLDQELVHDIRAALNHELVLGSSYFKDRIERMTKRRVRMGKPGRPRVCDEESSQPIDGPHK